MASMGLPLLKKRALLGHKSVFFDGDVRKRNRILDAGNFLASGYGTRDASAIILQPREGDTPAPHTGIG